MDEHKSVFVTAEEVESLKPGSCSFLTPAAYQCLSTAVPRLTSSPGVPQKEHSPHMSRLRGENTRRRWVTASALLPELSGREGCVGVLVLAARRSRSQREATKKHLCGLMLTNVERSIGF